ncbi:MAG: SDR family oxidoreductase [Candidatus Dormibacteraeota bacterium]|uniref:SDR family oxidoreductase n=1 Tax=Candidatus Dormiibacter inghamiae TaxID=3127013 RepID=A0A934K616_9BACT|nr:SDR family oxidoreductase [Candidatus Dormibacteraeota bacterium]MBJ7604959.1 SDR family oxidoreductase [Candidatus Dormibacteraeota bacterium]
MIDYGRLFSLAGRRALVIGAGRGIGRACAEGLAAQGAEVTCADLDLASAAATAAAVNESGGRALPLALDILQPQAAGQVMAESGVPDVLVVTPAINVRKPIVEIDDDGFDRVVELNLKANFRLLRDFGRAFAERGSGSIIVFSSIRAQVVEPGQGVYAATKAGLVQLVKVLAAELGPRGVRVNAVAPGVVETPLTAQIKDDPAWYRAYADKSALGRWAQPWEMVGAVAFLASDASSFVTGSQLFVDGGWTAVDGRFEPSL